MQVVRWLELEDAQLFNVDIVPRFSKVAFAQAPGASLFESGDGFSMLRSMLHAGSVRSAAPHAERSLYRRWRRHSVVYADRPSTQ